MLKTFMISKLHQARVTDTDREYEGSFSIDTDILQAAKILENEKIHIYNIDQGTRFSTYAIGAAKGSKRFGGNGACAYLVKPGDRIIVCTYAALTQEEWENHMPLVLYLDQNNNYRYKNPQPVKTNPATIA